MNENKHHWDKFLIAYFMLWLMKLVGEQKGNLSTLLSLNIFFNTDAFIFMQGFCM